MYIVYTKDGTERCVLNEIEYIGKYMNERAVTATLFSDIPILFEVGDYISYRKEKFTLTNEPSVKKTARARYTYSVKFVSESHKLAFVVFRDIVPHDNELIYPNHRQVDFTGDVTYLTERIQANLDKAQPDVWTIHVNPDADKTLVRSISAQNSNCWNALSMVNSEYGLNFYIRGNDIYVGYDEPIIDKEFKYGYGEGAYEIERVVKQDENIITKLSVTGTSRNLDTSYPKKPDWKDSNLSEDFFLYPLTLMIPEFKKDGKTDYILADDKYIAKYGVREGSVVIDEVYPSITDSVNDKGLPIDEVVEVGEIDNEKKHFELWLNNPNFTDSSGNQVPLKELMIPTKSKLVMKDGSLQGFGFFIIQAHDEGDRVRLVLERNSAEGMVGETQEKFTVPNTSISMKPGDKFVFIEIFMPQSYIRQAEERLEKRAREILTDSLKPKYTYNINVSDIFVANKDLYESVVEGQKLHLIDDGLGIDEAILIETISIKEGVGMIPQFKVTLNNEPRTTTKQVMKDQLSKIEGSVTNNYAALDELNSLLRRKLDKDIWDRVWEIVTQGIGLPSYIYGKMPVVTKYGITMYADKDKDADHTTIYDGLPIDNKTIKRRDDGVLYAIGGGGSTEDEVTKRWVELNFFPKDYKGAKSFNDAKSGLLRSINNVPSKGTMIGSTNEYIASFGTSNGFQIGAPIDNPARLFFRTMYIGKYSDWVELGSGSGGGGGTTDTYDKATIDRKLREKSDTGHTHSQYASTNHSHSQYANIDHKHSEYVTEAWVESKMLWEDKGSYILSDKNTATTGGITMYLDKDVNSNHSDLYEGLPIDNTTIKRRSDGVLYAAAGEGGTLTSITITIDGIDYVSSNGQVRLPNLVDRNWVNEKLTTKANSTHYHDDRYATKTDLHNGLLDKADRSHTHSQYLTEHQSLTHLATKKELEEKVISLNKEVSDLKARLAKLEAMWIDKGDHLYTDKNVVTKGSITMLKD